MPLIMRPKTITVHTNDGGPGVTLAPDFDLDAPLAWTDSVLVQWCPECFGFGHEPPAAQVERIRGELRGRVDKAHELWRLMRIGQGAETLDRDGVLALLHRENTWLDQQINADRFPRALYSGNKRVWLLEEALPAKARIIGEDTAAANRRADDKRHRPVNRHERRKRGAAPTA